MRETTAISRILGNVAGAMSHLNRWGDEKRNYREHYSDAEIALALLLGYGPFKPLVAAILGRSTGAIELVYRCANCSMEAYLDDERPDTVFHEQCRRVAYYLGMRNDVIPKDAELVADAAK